MSPQKGIVTAERAVAYSGPLPAASEFDRYERTLPGAANKLLEMADREALTRQNNDTTALTEGVKIARRGQYCACAIAFFALAIVLISVLMNRPMVSAIMPALVACVSLAAVFIDRRR